MEADERDFLRTFRRVWELAQREGRDDSLTARVRQHLGTDPAKLAVFFEQFEPFEHANLQTALDARLGEPGTSSELLGVGIENRRYMAFSLSDLLARGSVPLGPVDQVNFHLAGGRVLACVQYGLYLVTAGSARMVAFVAGAAEGGPRFKLRLEVVGTDGEACQAFLDDVTRLMRERNVYRGHVISIAVGQVQFGPAPQTLVQFHELPQVGRDAVVLPEATLERIERQTLHFSAHAEELLAAGRSLKRGLLLHGLPGTGKTLTIMYLAGQMPDRTVILTTGRSMAMIDSVARLARSLAPAMVVLEDVDLIAEERGNPFQRTGPLLFELLNEMDGLRDDADVIFVLTTNRADLLEPALAARPGRIDLAVEIPLPDLDGRRRLVELYGRGLVLDGVDVEGVAARTEGATPAYIKELLRKAAVLAAEAGRAPRVAPDDVEAAMAELAEGGRLAERLVGLRPDAAEPLPAPGLPPGVTARPVARWTGFPTSGS